MMINVKMARIRMLSARDLMYSHHDVVGNVGNILSLTISHLELIECQHTSRYTH